MASYALYVTACANAAHAVDPAIKVVVAGCLAAQDRDRMRAVVPHVDGIYGTKEFRRLRHHIAAGPDAPGGAHEDHVGVALVAAPEVRVAAPQRRPQGRHQPNQRPGRLGLPPPRQRERELDEEQMEIVRAEQTDERDLERDDERAMNHPSPVGAMSRNPAATSEIAEAPEEVALLALVRLPGLARCARRTLHL